MCLEAGRLELLTVTTIRPRSFGCIWFSVSEITPGPMEFGLAVTSSYMQKFAAFLSRESCIGPPIRVCASATVNRAQGLVMVACDEAAVFDGSGRSVTPSLLEAD